MSSGLYSGTSGLALGTGLYRNVSGLWGGASGLVSGLGGGGSQQSLNLNLLYGPLDSRVTFSRASTATYFNSSGVITLAAVNEARFDHFPSTLLPRGLLLEGSRTNDLLNSLIDGTSLGTQSVTVTEQVYTLSFYGSGQIALSGAASATVVGNGAFPERRTYTFTPTAGSLALTVTGTVQYAQLEAGPFASSFIPTAGAAVTRAADSAAMVGGDFSSWYSLPAGSIAVGAEPEFGTVAGKPSALLLSGPGNFHALYLLGSSGDIGYDVGSSDTSLDFLSGTYTVSALPLLQASLLSSFTYQYAVYGQAISYTTDAFANSGNGGPTTIDTSGDVPVGLTSMALGPNDGSLGYGGWFGWLRGVQAYSSALDASGLDVLSATAGASPASLSIDFLTGQYYTAPVPFQTPPSLYISFTADAYVVEGLI